MEEKKETVVEETTEQAPNKKDVDDAKKEDSKTKEEGNEKVISMTQTQLDSLIDKKLAKERDKAEKERSKAEELAKLSENERNQKLLEDKEAEIATKEQEINRREFKLQAIDVLTENKLPITCADFLISDTADATHENIKKFGKAFNDAVQSAVEDRIKSNTYVPNGGDSADTKAKTPVDTKFNINLKK